MHVLRGTFVSLVLAVSALVGLFLGTDRIWMVWGEIALPLVMLTVGVGLAIDAVRAYRRLTSVA